MNQQANRFGAHTVGIGACTSKPPQTSKALRNPPVLHRRQTAWGGGSLAIALAALLLGGCAIRLPEASAIADAAVLTLDEANLSTDGVQLIVHDIDGRRPEKAGPVASGDRITAAEYSPGTVVSQPPLRPARSSFAVAPGERRIGLIFAVPGSGLLNLLAVTRARGSEATGISLVMAPGCQYIISAKLTLATGRDFKPEVRTVRPIPAQFGVKPAVSCPSPRDVVITVLRD